MDPGSYELASKLAAVIQLQVPYGKKISGVKFHGLLKTALVSKFRGINFRGICGVHYFMERTGPDQIYTLFYGTDQTTDDVMFLE